MSTHTKGPWIISKPQHCAPDQKNDRLIHDKEMRHIAEVFQYQNNQNPNGASVANAHLIAAAPEMMEALEQVHDYLNARNLGESAAILEDSIKAIIRKAKGE